MKGRNRISTNEAACGVEPPVTLMLGRNKKLISAYNELLENNNRLVRDYNSLLEDRDRLGRE